MKKRVSISINNPCTEEWENFSSTKEGGYCHSCKKNVVDYTRMSDEQVLAIISKSSGKICGRLRQDQMRTYEINKSKSARLSFNWAYSGLITLLLLLVERYSVAGHFPLRPEIENVKIHDNLQPKDTTEGHVVQGTVVDKESKEILPGVNVVLKGTNIGTVTDFKGYFKFPKRLKEGDVLVFSFIGLTSKEFKIPKNAPETIEIPMLAMVCDIMGELNIDEIYKPKSSTFVRLWEKVKKVF